MPESRGKKKKLTGDTLSSFETHKVAPFLPPYIMIVLDSFWVCLLWVLVESCGYLDTPRADAIMMSTCEEAGSVPF